MNQIQHFEQGVFGVIVHSIGKVLRNGLIGLIIGVVLGEALGIALNPTPGFNPPNLFVHVSAGALGLFLAFGVAMATALTEAIQAALTAARAVEGDVKQAVGTGLGDVGHAIESVEHKEPKS